MPKAKDGLKVCSKCHGEKPVSEFYKDRCAFDGLAHRCKICVAIYNSGNTARAVTYKAKYGVSEKCRATLAMYAASEEGKVTAARYRATAKGKMVRRHAEARRRARKMDADGSHTYLEFTLLCEAEDCRCLACEKAFPLETLTEDHIVPLSRGGSDNISNIQPLCKSCNCHKGIRATDYRVVTMMGMV